MPITLPNSYTNAPSRLADVTQTMLDLYNVVQQINAGAAISSFDVTAPSTVTVNSASNAFTITQTGSGNSLLVEDSASPDPSPFVIDANGAVMQGIQNVRTNFSTAVTPDLQVEKTAVAAISITRDSTTPTGAFLYFGKSRANTLLSNTIVTASDTFGTISFQGADGTTMTQGAQIIGSVDGTPGAGVMPGKLVFSTSPSGSSLPTERMRIDNGGGISFNKTVTPPGTTGAQTINTPTGTVNFAATATSLVVTNSLVSVGSIILVTLGTVDTTMKSAVAVASAGSFTITANAAATAETIVNFTVFK